MKLLYGTGNLAKLSAMRNRLEQLDIGRREGIMDVVDLLKRLSNRNISHNKETFYEK